MDPNDERIRYARKLRTSGLILRIIGVGVMGCAVIGVLVALNLRRSDDRVGFTLISLSVLVLAGVVWGSGVFHSAVARFLPSVLVLEDKLDALSQAKKPRRALRTEEQVTEPAPVAGPPVSDAAMPSALAAETFAEAGPSSTIPEPWATSRHLSQPPDAAATTNTEATREADSPAAPAAEPLALEQTGGIPEAAEPERVPCPHCAGRIHPEASRCVHCMRRIERPAALPS